MASTAISSGASATSKSRSSARNACASSWVSARNSSSPWSIAMTMVGGFDLAPALSAGGVVGGGGGGPLGERLQQRRQQCGPALDRRAQLGAAGRDAARLQRSLERV